MFFMRENKKACLAAGLPDINVVRPERFELPTYRFVACCSIQLSYERPTTANIGGTCVSVKHFFIMFVLFLFLCVIEQNSAIVDVGKLAPESRLLP